MKCQSNFFLCSTRHCWGSPNWCLWPYEPGQWHGAGTAALPQAHAMQQHLSTATEGPSAAQGCLPAAHPSHLQPPWCGVLHQSQAWSYPCPQTYSWRSQTRHPGLSPSSFPKQAQALCSEQLTHSFILMKSSLRGNYKIPPGSLIWAWLSLWESVWVVNKVISQSHSR